MLHIAYIGIGSNVGDRIEQCHRAIALLDEHPKISIRALSRWYESAALGPDHRTAAQASYINGAVQVETTLHPDDLLAALQAIEGRLGRPSPRPKGEPRTIDLDILLYDDLVIEMHELQIPHPRLPKRMFVLLPLCDIAPDVSEPNSGLTLRELAAQCEASQPSQSIHSIDEGKA